MINLTDVLVARQAAIDTYIKLANIEKDVDAADPAFAPLLKAIEGSLREAVGVGFDAAIKFAEETSLGRGHYQGPG